MIFEMFKICHKNTNKNNKHDLFVFNFDYEFVLFKKFINKKQSEKI